MRTVFYFTKKELIESWRTVKLGLFIVIFLILSLMSPLLAKLTPEILKHTVGDSFALQLPKPTSLDSWTQFYKNLTQIGLIVITLLFSGTVSNEVSRGTLVNLVTKGLKRSTVVVSKSVSLFVQWTLCLGMAFFVTWGYTFYYFPDNKSPHLFLGIIPLWLFGIFLLSLVLLCSTLARSNYEGLLLTGGVILVFILLNFVDLAKTYNPIALISENLLFLQKRAVFLKYIPAYLITLFLTLLFNWFAILVLNKKKL